MNADSKTENVLEKLLEEALSEIEKNMKAKKVPKPDEHVDHIIQKCDAVFQSLQDKLTELYSKEFIQRSNDNIEADVKDGKYSYMLELEELENDFDQSTYDQKREQISYIFPTYNSRDAKARINKILLLKDDGSKIVTILPYLLTAYYLNLFGTRRIRANISTELSKTPDEKVIKDSTYSRDVTASVKMFSYGWFLPQFYKAGRNNTLSKIEKITNKSEFVRYLLTGKKRALPQLFYVQMYKVFIYSVIAVACIEELSDTSYHVDYEKSWALFDAHTCALPSVLSGYYRRDSTTEFRKSHGALLDDQYARESLFRREFVSAVDALLDGGTVDMSEVISALNVQAIACMESKKYDSIQACSLSFPGQQNFECLGEYESLAYALRLLLSPFVVNGSDCPGIENDILVRARQDTETEEAAYRVRNEPKDPPQMPYVALHAREKRPKTGGNKSENAEHKE